jgi:hypothetical protein
LPGAEKTMRDRSRPPVTVIGLDNWTSLIEVIKNRRSGG